MAADVERLELGPWMTASRRDAIVEGSRCRQRSTGDFDGAVGKGSEVGEDQSIGKGADGAVEVDVMGIGELLWNVRVFLIGKGKWSSMLLS